MSGESGNSTAHTFLAVCTITAPVMRCSRCDVVISSSGLLPIIGIGGVTLCAPCAEVLLIKLIEMFPKHPHVWACGAITTGGACCSLPFRHEGVCKP